VISTQCLVISVPAAISPHRKLVPALFELFRQSGCPSEFVILGCCSTPLAVDDGASAGKMAEALAETIP